MNKSIGLWSLFILIVVGTSILITLGFATMVKRQNHLVSECVKTNYYVIGNRGLVTQIYECPEGYQR